MYPKIAIIVLNWNGWKDTIECLESLYQITYPNYDVILVDNASQDNSVEKIKEYCKGKLKINSKFFNYNPNNKPIYVLKYKKNEAEKGGKFSKEKYFSKLPSNRKLRLILNDKNYGFAEGNNIGIRYAMKALKPEYILLLNNDTVVDKRFLDELVEVAESDNKIGLIQPMILRYHDGLIDNIGILYDTYGFIRCKGALERSIGQYKGIIKDFFYADGACVLIRKRLIEHLLKLWGEVFDKELFAYHEDIDLSWNARLLGFEVACCPRSICYHKGGGSSGGHNPRTVYWSYRNRLRVLIKNYEFKNLVKALPGTIALELFFSIRDSIKYKDFRYFLGFLKGVLWNIVNLKNTLKARQIIQKARIVCDEAVKKYMT